MSPGTVKNEALGYMDLWSDVMQLLSLLPYGHEMRVCAATGSYEDSKRKEKS